MGTRQSTHSRSRTRRARESGGKQAYESKLCSCQLNVSLCSSLVGFLLLVDTLQAIGLRRTPNMLVGELFIKMPSSDHSFRTIYNSLIHGYALPSDVQNIEDAVFLLISILNDVIYMQQCHLAMPRPPRCQGNGTHDLSGGSDLPLQNPWPPLSLQTEFCRLSADMSTALSKWHHLFKDVVTRDVLALYYFAELQLLCPDLGCLFHLAGYEMSFGFVGDQSGGVKNNFDISDKASDLAWLILEHAGNNSSSPQQRLSIWLPVVLFSSALVVWYKIQGPEGNKYKYGTLSVLTAFKHEISILPWPCCEAMTQTLGRLMER